MKINQFTKGWLQRFNDPEDEGGMSPAEILAADLPKEEETETTETETETETEVEPAKPSVDAAAIAAAMKEALSGLVPAKGEPKQEQKPLTPEEAKKLLNFFEPDDELVSKFHNVDTTKEALAQLRDGFTRQMLTIVQHLVAEREDGIHGKYGPLLTRFEEQENVAREQRFNAKYSELAKPEFRPLISAVIQNLQSQGFKAKDEDGYFTAVAKGVEAVMKTANPEFKLTSVAKAAVNKPGNPNALQSAKPGAAKGGGAASSGTERPKNLALSILTSK